MRLDLDFASEPGRNFGFVTPLIERVRAIPDVMDIWLPENTPENMLVTDGRVEEWRGAINRHILGHPVFIRRPKPEGGLIRCSSDAQSPMGQLDLMAEPIGSPGALTIAIHGEIHPEQLGVDNQYFWGTSVIGAFARVAYRYTNGTRYIRYQTNDNRLNLDIPLPSDWSGRVGVVVVIDGSTVSMHLSTGASGAMELTERFTMLTFSVGHAVQNGLGNLRGYLGNLGIWNRVASGAELRTLTRWVA